MFNITKADIKRILLSKSLIVMPIVLFVMVLIVSGLFAGLQYLAKLDLSAIIGDSMETLGVLSAMPSNGYQMAITNLQSDTLIYVLLIVMLSVSAFDFSSGTIKNLLSIGKSKIQIYTSKLITSYIWTIFAVIVYGILSVLIGYIVFAEMPTSQELAEFAVICLKQIPIYLSIITFGHMFVFITQKTALSLIFYIGSFLLFETIVPILDLALKLPFKFSFLMPLFQLIELTNSNTELTGYLAIYISTFVYMIIAGFSGYYIFKKSELK